MGNFEAIGDAVTGGVVGRAVEPAAGEARAGEGHPSNCLNCGAELAGDYCHVCGQHAHVRRTLGDFFHDFAHGVLHFEGKIFRTVPLLVWKPGELTRRYIDGQRASFVSPIALFLFCVFLMFSAVGLFGGNLGHSSPAAKHDIAEEVRGDQQKLATLQAQRTALQRARQSTASVDEQITDTGAEIAALRTATSGGNSLHLNNSGLPHWLSDAIATAQKNPDLVAYKLKSSAYKFSWLIIPLSVPFVWLLFPFSRRFGLYDHLVFVTYSLCFMTLLVVAGVILGAVGLGTIGGVLALVPPVHMYRQLRGAYGLGWFGALWRTLLLTIFALLVISLFAVLLVGLGLFD